MSSSQQLACMGKIMTLPQCLLSSSQLYLVFLLLEWLVQTLEL